MCQLVKGVRVYPFWRLLQTVRIFDDIGLAVIPWGAPAEAQHPSAQSEGNRSMFVRWEGRASITMHLLSRANVLDGVLLLCLSSSAYSDVPEVEMLRPCATNCDHLCAVEDASRV